MAKTTDPIKYQVQEILNRIFDNAINALDVTALASFFPANQSAFGTLETAELTPTFQGDFVYGLNTQLWSSAVVLGVGASVDTDSSRLRIQSGTGSSGYAYIQTRRPARYRAGQGTNARFTPLFSQGLANSTQVWGMFSIVSNEPFDGYGFGFNGTSFGIVHYRNGTSTWIPQSSWNGDKLDGSEGSAFTYDPTKGSPVMIKYPYLGYGNIFFYIQSTITGSWVLVHTIRYANTTTQTELSNPTLRFTGFTKNSGNTTNTIMYCGSVGIFISGVRSFIGNPKWATRNNKSSITTETNLLTLRNASTYNGRPNTGLLRLSSLSLASSAASGVSAFFLKLGTTLGGAPSYTPIKGSTSDNGITITSGNSTASVDVAGTTVTGGDLLFVVSKDNPSSQFIDLLPYELFVAPGEILTISGESSNTSQLGVGVNWIEDI